MSLRRLPDDAPEEFRTAVAQLRSATLRPEVVLEELPAPTRIAPFAVAFGAELTVAGEDLATGRFVLLHDPAAPEAWEGSFRAVTFVRAALESDLGLDPMLGQVGWSWLQDALAAAGADHRATGGTVTRVVSESFGSLADRPSTVEVEIRASWTPDGGFDAHLQAWAALLGTVGGLPPVPPGVSPLARRR